MAPTLHDLLGIDPEDPHTACALEDAEAYASLVETLVVARKKRGLSQRQVAERMGTTQSTVSDFERAGGDARYSTLQRYARAVDTRMHSMIDHSCSTLAPAWQAAAAVPVRVAVRERGSTPRSVAWRSDDHRTVSA